MISLSSTRVAGAIVGCYRGTDCYGTEGSLLSVACVKKIYN